MDDINKLLYTEIHATHIVTGEVLKFKHVPDASSYFSIPAERILKALCDNGRVKSYILKQRPSYFL